MKTRKNSAPHDQPHPRLGLMPRMAVPFAASGGGSPPVEICCLDYALVKLLRITNAGSEPLAIVDLVVNNEFEPGAALTDEFRLFRYPVELPPGASFEFILQPPSTANIPFDCCYPKPPMSLAVCTSIGSFDFQAGKAVLPWCQGNNFAR